MRVGDEALKQVVSGNPHKAAELAQSLLDLARGNDPINVADVWARPPTRVPPLYLENLDPGWRNRFLSEAAQIDEVPIREMFAKRLPGQKWLGQDGEGEA